MNPQFQNWIRLHVYKNDVGWIRNILEKLSSGEKIDHTKEILKLAKKAVQDKRFPRAYNCLNVLSHIYEILPGDFRPKVARKFGQYLNRGAMREFSTSIDYDKLFGIFPHMNENDKDDILTVLSGAIYSEKKVNTTLVTKLIDHSDIIGDEPKRKMNDTIIRMLDSESPGIAEEIIRLISKNETARRNLFEQRLLEKTIDKITMDENGRQKGVDLYLEMKDIANQKTREKLISKELDFLAESAADKVTKVKQVLDVLLKLKLDAVFEIFSGAKRNDFLKSDIREVLTSGNPSDVRSLDWSILDHITPTILHLKTYSCSNLLLKALIQDLV